MNSRNVGWLALAGLALAGCSDTMMTSAPAGKPAVTTANVVRQDLTGYLFVDGKVLIPPGAQAQAFAPYDLPISEVLTEVGKRVGKGQAIVRLTIPGAAETISQAEANMRATQAAYNAARAQVSTPVKEAEQMLADARAAERQARLDAQNGLPNSLEAATQDRMAAEANLASAKQQVDGQLLAERQSIAIAAEYLKEARAGSKLASVRAPITGTVVTLEAKTGMQAKARQPLATIVDLDDVRIQGVLPAEFKDNVKVGTEALISLASADSKPLDGTVVDIEVLPPVEGQKSPGYLVEVKFDNREGLVKPETSLRRLGLKTATVKDALVVPIDAVSKNAKGEAVVYVLSGKDWVETSVVTGPSDGALIVIKSGLSEGQVVRVEKSVGSA